MVIIALVDPDGNKRYAGANPNNYVSFNGELLERLVEK